MVRLKILGFAGLIVALASGVFASLEGGYGRDKKHGFVHMNTIRDDVLQKEEPIKNNNFFADFSDADDETISVGESKASEGRSSD